MEVQDQTIILSLDDVAKDNQENFYKGNNSAGTTAQNNGNSTNGGRIDGGYQRKNYYHNNYQRPGRQGHNPHYSYNNGYNNPYNNGYSNGNNHHQHNGYSGGGGGRNYKRNNYYHNDHYASQQNNNYQHAPNNHQHYRHHHNQYNNYHRNNYYQQNNQHFQNRHSSGYQNGISQPHSSIGTGPTAAPVSSGAISPSSATQLSYSRPSSVVSTSSDKLTDTLSSSSSVDETHANLTAYTSEEDEGKGVNISPSPVPTVTVVVNSSLPQDPTHLTPLFNDLGSKDKTNGAPKILPATQESSSGISTNRYQNINYVTESKPSYYSYPPAGHGHHQFHVHGTRGGGGSTGTDHFHHSATRYNGHYQNGNGSAQGHRRGEATYELFSPQNGQIPYPHFFQSSNFDPLLSHGPVFNPGPHFMFPEIQFSEPGKQALNLADVQRGLAWAYEPEGIDELCHLQQLPESPSHGTNTGAHKKRASHGGFTNRSPNPQQPFHRRFWEDGKSFGFEERCNHTLRIDDLLDRFHYVDESEKPDELAPMGHEYEKLSEQVWTKFQNNQQTRETFTKKLELWRDLSECVRKYNPEYHLEMVGSTISGFGSNTSDVDMCLILNHRNEVNPRAEAIDILEAMCPLFEQIPNLTRKELILAKVPILKLRENVQGIDVDINVNNSVGIRNSSLLHSYALCDWRVRPLVLVVKLWAQVQGINDAKLMTLSSYSLALMVIHFLQHAVSPRVLPALQQIPADQIAYPHPDRFQHLAEIWRVKKALSDVGPSAENLDNNQSSLGELLVGFLEYFAVKFDYRTSAVCIRNGGTLTIRACSNNRAPKNDAYQWKHICIEEPFEYTNTARSVYDKDSFDRIRGVFFSSWQRLVISRNLDTIFQSISPGEARSIGARARQCSSS